MPAAKKISDAPILQMKVTLLNSKPPIWRRILVPSNFTFKKLHDILQVAMGWSNSHMHEFVVNGEHIGDSDPEFGLDDVRDESRIRLTTVISLKRFRYQYDFGDSWEHDILIEKVLEPDPNQPYPHCVKGKRACPPEDIGGVWGYDSFLEVMKDPAHPEYETYVEWIGGEFDAEAFDEAEVNEILHGIR